jgi:chorismate dehydratase
MSAKASTQHPLRVGCVKFLNTKPLIDGLDGEPGVALRSDVPSALLDELVAGVTDVALCPVIDYQRSPAELAVVPVGGIGCDGPTMTVRLVSRLSIGQITTVHTDTDSHTSIALMRVILAEMYGIEPTITDLTPDALNHAVRGDGPDTLLVIGDKVVTHHPAEGIYRHVLDLGEAWKDHTGLPFVFAVWMARPDTKLGDWPKRMTQLRQANAQRIGAIVGRYAAPLGWPTVLAREYLEDCLRFEVGPRQLEAMAQFWQRAAQHGLIERVRPLRLHDDAR